MRRVIYAFIALWAVIGVFVAESLGRELFVATNGLDSNPGTLAQPFASLTGAQAVVRSAIASGLTESVSVYIRGGAYFITNTWVLDTRDSGTPNYAISYSAYSNEIPVFSGARVVSGWTNESNNKWSVILPNVATGGWWFNQLFVDDAWATRARWPNEDEGLLGRGYLVITNVDTNAYQWFQFDQAIPGGNLACQDAELFTISYIHVSRNGILSSSNTECRTADPAIVRAAQSIGPGDRAYLEGSYAFLDKAGEWSLTRTNGKLTYLSAPGDNPNNHTFRAPVMEMMVKVSGATNLPLINLSLVGLRFECNQWLLPSNGVDSAYQDGYNSMVTSNTFSSQTAPCALEITYSRNCRFQGLRVAHTGGSGIGIGAGCHSNEVMGCDIYDTGSIGLHCGWYGTNSIAAGAASAGYRWLQPGTTIDHPEWTPNGNKLTDNYVHESNRRFLSGAGINCSYSTNSLVACNYVSDQEYFGIFGWDRITSGEAPETAPVIEFNHVRNVTRKVSDGGGISSFYIIDTVYRENLIHDVNHDPSGPGYDNHGLYVDNPTTNGRVIANMIFDTRHGFDIHISQSGVMLPMTNVLDNVLETEIRISTGGCNICNNTKFLDSIAYTNTYYHRPTPSEYALAEQNTGPRNPYRMALGLESYLARNVFNDWVADGYGTYTNGGWEIARGGTIMSREACMGRVCRFSETNGSYLKSPLIACTNPVVMFWRKNGTASNAALCVETSPSGTSNWTIRAVSTDSSTSWVAQASRLSVTGSVYVRISRTNTVAAGNWLDIDGVSVGQRLTQSPMIAAISPPSGSDLQATSVVMNIAVQHVVGWQNISGVWIGGAAAANLSNGSWAGSVALAPGSNVVSIAALDAYGNSVTQTVVYYRGVTHYVSLSGGNVFPYTNGWASAATTIQAAVSSAVDGDAVVVSNGQYKSGGIVAAGIMTRVAITNRIAVRSVGGPNGPYFTSIVGATGVVDGFGAGAVRCVYISGTGACLSGFTVTNGSTDCNFIPTDLANVGAGILMVSQATISNCIVRNNRGCGYYGSDGNRYQAGSGIYMTGPTGMLICATTIAYNQTPAWAGGIYNDHGKIRNCVIVGNSAAIGGGIQMVSYTLNSAAVEDSYIYGNAATYAGGQDGGGGIYGTVGKIVNCTIVGNSAGSPGGGVSFVNNPFNGSLPSPVKIYNSIIVSNTSLVAGKENYNFNTAVEAVTFFNCCALPVLPSPYSGGGNIATSPQFASYPTSDYHLTNGSPCVNAGLNVLGLESKLDNDGQSRIFNRIVDIGADEWVDPSGPILSVTPTNGSRIRATAVVVNVNANDQITGCTGVVSVTVNGLPANRSVSPCAWTQSVALSEGPNPVTSVGVDLYGNATTQVLTYIRDMTPPAIVSVAPTNNFITPRTNVVIAVRSEDLLQNCYGVTNVTVNGAKITRSTADSCIWTGKVALTSATSAFVIVSSDDLGNSSTQTVSYKKIYPVALDYDGDGKADQAVYHQAGNTWYVLRSSTGSQITKTIGPAGLTTGVPVSGDYDGDGVADFAILDRGPYNWYIELSSSGQIWTPQYGYAGTIPVQADYDGDRKTDLSVWHSGTFAWHHRRSSDGTLVNSGAFGYAGVVPVPADYDGDRKADLAVYHDAGNANTRWYIARSAQGFITYVYGYSGTVAVESDFDGDSVSDVALYDASTGGLQGWWYLFRTALGYQAFKHGKSSAGGAIPVPADYDGDGKSDATYYDGNTGTWYVWKSTTLTTNISQYGWSAALPILPQYQINRLMGKIP